MGLRDRARSAGDAAERARDGEERRVRAEAQAQGEIAWQAWLKRMDITPEPKRRDVETKATLSQSDPDWGHETWSVETTFKFEVDRIRFWARTAYGGGINVFVSSAPGLKHVGGGPITSVADLGTALEAARRRR